MKIRVSLVFGVLPAIICYSEKTRHDGINVGPIIFRRVDCDPEDRPVRAEVNVRQFYRTFGLHSVLHRYIPEYQIRHEIESDVQYLISLYGWQQYLPIVVRNTAKYLNIHQTMVQTLILNRLHQLGYNL